jgi:hypothetical protein
MDMGSHSYLLHCHLKQATQTLQLYPHPGSQKYNLPD